MQTATVSQSVTKAAPPAKSKMVWNKKAEAEKAKAKDEPAVRPKFDYASIADAKVRAKVKKIATDIHGYQRSTNKSFLDTGKALIAVKDDLKTGKNGRFGDWLLKEFQWSIRTAQNYMAVTEAFGDAYHDLTYLPAQHLYRLASGKKLDNVRGQVVAAAKSGEPMSEKDVLQLMSKAGGSKPATDKADTRRTAAAKAMDILQKELSDFDGFMVLVQEAGTEFAKVLKGAA